MVPISLRSAPLDCFERNPDVLSCFADLKRNSNRMGVSESLKLRRKVEVSARFKGNKRKPKTDWRRSRDSNPRDPFESNGFQDRRFQPLTHSSTLNYTARAPIPGNLAAFSASNAPSRAYSINERQPASAASTSKQETCSSRTILNSPTPTLLRKISISTDGIFCAV